MQQLFSQYKKIYVIGAYGIGTSALAQFFKHVGKEVSGSDRDESPSVDAVLHKVGITVVVGQKWENVPEDADLVLYSDAVPENNPERVRVDELGIPTLTYFQALGAVTREYQTLAVAGTHGKTTTTALAAEILKHSDRSPTAIVGSLVTDWHSNFLAGHGSELVVEACEYRNHLLELSPRVLVVTNIELDHTDFFHSLEELQKAFRSAMESVPSDGAVITNPHSPTIAPLLTGLSCRVVDYTTETVGQMKLLGEFNRENARAAKAAARALLLGAFSDTAADEAIAKFAGTWRRFEYKGKTATGALVYDDYAHHPTAVSKTIAAAREHFPEKKLLLVFHPHLYSRTKSFLQEFAVALARAGEVLIAPIYAAREEPDPTISNDILAERVQEAGGHARALPSFDAIIERLNSCDEHTLILTMGAGDIYKVADKIVA